jgi:hypothetical protein
MVHATHCAPGIASAVRRNLMSGNVLLWHPGGPAWAFWQPILAAHRSGGDVSAAAPRRGGSSGWPVATTSCELADGGRFQPPAARFEAEFAALDQPLAASLPITVDSCEKTDDPDWRSANRGAISPRGDSGKQILLFRESL